MGQTRVKGLLCTPSDPPRWEYTPALPRGGTVTVTETHRDVQKAGTTGPQSHSQQRGVRILTSSHPLHGPFCSLNIAFLGFPRPIFFPKYTILGAAAGRESQSSQNAQRKEQGATYFAHLHHQGCKEACSSNKQALCVPLPYTMLGLGTQR